MIDQQLDLPGIEYAPLKVRRYGLQEAHSYPLVSDGKQAGRYQPSFRVTAPQAWMFPELEYGRTPNSVAALLFDLDQDGPFLPWLDDIFQGDLPRPNWITWRKTNRHAHVCYTLARPVLTGEQARMTPQAWLARIGEYLAVTLQADRAYNAVLAHNPMSVGHKGRYRTDWERREPYTLEELNEYIPAGWRRPRKLTELRTAYGRNDALFRAGMKWTGQPAHWGDWTGLETHLEAINNVFDLPLGQRELGGIVKSVVKYQEWNLASGQTQRTFSFIQAARGKRSGAARRKGTPLEQDRTPWVTAGVSRRTWYRRQAGQHTGQHGGDRRSKNFK